MREQDKIKTLLSKGVSSATAERLVNLGYSATSLAPITLKQLRKDFSEEDSKLIRAAVRREAIPEDVVNRLIVECDWKCCFCFNGFEQPVIIHHIDGYAKSQNNEYENLAVLCLRHHGEVHMKSDLAQRSMPSHLIRVRKRAWADIVAKVKQGGMTWPTNQMEMLSGLWKSDVEALGDYRAFFNRKAFHRRFDKEDNMSDFEKTMKHLLTLTRTGLRQTGAGMMTPTRPPHTFDNANWAGTIEIIGDRLEDIGDRFAVAVRDGELSYNETGWYEIHSSYLGVEIDNMRDTVIALFNKLLLEAGLRTLRGVRRSVATKAFEAGDGDGDGQHE